MSLINEEDKAVLVKRLEEIKNPVEIIHFTQSKAGIALPESFNVPPCPYCREAQDLISEFSALSDKITLKIYDWYEEEKRKEYGVFGLPTTIVRSQEKDFGIRFMGLVSGYEFASFLETVIMVGKGATSLSEDGKAKIKKEITKQLEIKVFVTPTCPYCPQAVFLAHQVAMESELVKSWMIEATEFPELASRFQVMAVPKTVINDLYSFEGALPESVFLDQLIKAQKEEK